MVRMITAHTTEIDDVEFAVQELLAQLDLDHQLLKSSAGVVTCYSEFIDSGVVQALAEALPFDIIGSTTIANADRGERSLMMLSISVLTSDDVQIAAGYSDSLSGEQESALRKLYESTAAKLPSEPKLMISCLPLLFHIGGDETVDMMDKICGGVPNFGITAVDHTLDYHTAQTFFGGEASKDRMAMLLLSGDVSPRFYIAQLSEENILRKGGLITASNRSLLMEVNGMPVLRYMESIGIAENGQLDEVGAVPYVVDFQDGTPPLIRAIFAFTPEGYAACGGVMPVNALLAVGSIDEGDVKRTTEKALSEIIEAQSEGEQRSIMMFSCIARMRALSMDVEAEMELIESTMPEGIVYQFSYAGGEVCPVYDKDGRPHSRYHNDTLAIMTL